MTRAAPAEPRRLSLWLVVGVVAAPLLFAWLTLRRDYSKDVRRGAFLHLGMSVLIGLTR